MMYNHIMSMFLFFLPGILLIFSDEFRKKGLCELLIYIIAFSLSFFVLFPWFIKPLGLSLLGSTYLIFMISIVLVLAGIKKLHIKEIIFDKNELVILCIFMILMILRLVPMVLQIAPAGADMSMHSYIARLIYDNDGIPDSYKPLLPIKNFGTYPTGFPSLSALISLTSNISVLRSSLFTACLAHALIAFGLYLLLLGFFDKNTAAATSIFTGFLTRNPQWVIRWGGNPTVLAIFFLIIAVALIIGQKDRPSVIKSILASLALAATLVTHTIIFYSGMILISILLALYLRSHKEYWSAAIWGFLSMAMFLLPFLISYRPVVTRFAIDFSRVWQNIYIKSVLYDIIGGLPFIAVSLVGLIILLHKNRPIAKVFLITTLVNILLIINYKFWILPFSFILYPDRVAMLLIIPLSIFAAPAISRMISNKNKFYLVPLVLLGSIYYFYFYLYNSYSMVAVTQADINAFGWIDKTISKKAVIMNNYGDAGLWIPAIIGRSITTPASEPIHGDELNAGLLKLRPNYIYIGSKAVYPIVIRSDDLDKKPWKYKRIYSEGGAQVWKIL